MHHLHSNQIPNILIKLAHEIIHVEEVIELPAFADHRVAKQIAQMHRFCIVGGGRGEVADVG